MGKGAKSREWGETERRSGQTLHDEGDVAPSAAPLATNCVSHRVRLAPSQVQAVRGLLQVMLDPVSRAIANAPVEDDPLTAEEAHALGEAREWLKHNRPIPHEQVLADLGITHEEIEVRAHETRN